MPEEKTVNIETMRNTIFIATIIILTCLSACKDDCLTCPENEAAINGECQCIEIYFNGECKSRESSFEPKYIRGTSVSFHPLFSEAKECNSVFDFNNQPLFIYLSEITKYDNRVSAVIAIQTEARPTNTYFDKVYYSGLESERGSSNFDSLSYDWPSAYEYNGFVYVGEDAVGTSNPEHYTTIIDGETCYLRPYIKILDRNYIRVTFRYVTATEQVKAECVRLFHK